MYDLLAGLVGHTKEPRAALLPPRSNWFIYHTLSYTMPSFRILSGLLRQSCVTRAENKRAKGTTHADTPSDPGAPELVATGTVGEHVPALL